MAGLITRRGDRIIWSDFRSLTGAYSRALPPAEDSPDPYTADLDDGSHDHTELPLPSYSFDAEQYLATVAAATEDRSWENRPQAVVREIYALRPDLRGIWPLRTGDRIEVNYRRPGMKMLDWAELDIPPGAPRDVAASLVLLLEHGPPLGQVKGAGLWR